MDLVKASIATGIGDTPFAIADAERARLLSGLDPISHTQTYADAISAFEKARFESHPWAAVPFAADRADQSG